MIIHTVTENETLSSIAAQYNLSADYLARINELNEPYPLAVGQDIVIAEPAQFATVASGDSLTSISDEYGISLQQLLRNNPELANRETLYPGESVIVSFVDQDSPRPSLSVIGYCYPYIDLSLLRTYLPFLTYLSIFTYGFTLEGELIPVDDEELLQIARSFETRPILLFSTLGPDGRFSNELANRLLNDEAMQERIISALIYTMQRKGYTGLDIDFEYILPEDREAYVAFVSLLTERMNAVGFEVLVALAPKYAANQPGLLYESHDYPALGAAANSVLLMTYEWGYTFGPPMAVSPINKVREILDYAVTEIPPEKTNMGIPNYGYDWPLPYVRDVSKATSIGNVQAVDRALEYGVRIQYDTVAQAPFFYYTALDNIPHVVWFENARSIMAKLSLVPEYGFMGVGYWNIMRDFPQNRLLLNLLFEISKGLN